MGCGWDHVLARALNLLLLHDRQVSPLLDFFMHGESLYYARALQSNQYLVLCSKLL